MKGSWKTTAFGIGSILAAAWALIGGPILDGVEQTVPQYAEFFAIASAGLVGLFARDNKVSSEDVGAK